MENIIKLTLTIIISLILLFSYINYQQNQMNKIRADSFKDAFEIKDLPTPLLTINSSGNVINFMSEPDVFI